MTEEATGDAHPMGGPTGGAHDQSFDDLPLSERFPEYLVVFGIGLGVAIVVGIPIGVFSSASVGAAVAYMIMMVGVLFLLVGGLSGSGFNAGGFGGMFTGSADENERTRDREREGANAADQRARQRGYGRGSEDGSGSRRRRRDPAAAVQQRLNAGPNPRAFWSVAAGFVYVLLGVALASVFP
jgi:hypothetical protein